jgi:murein DD-endopeptidase MepM/ murein hydrolase activator NlpD
MSPWSRRLTAVSAAVVVAFILPTSAQATVSTNAPAAAQAAPVVAVNTPVQAPEVAALAAASSSYRVVSGDTLSGIAGRYGTTWPTLWHANTFISNPDLIYPDQVLSIPDGSSSSAPAPAAPAPAAAPVSSGTGWFNPLPGHVSYCNYWEWRKTPTGGYNHRGEDIPAGSGTPIHAVHAGSVSIQWDNGGGNMTIITHDGMAEVYMHQSSYAVRSGHVNGGDVIGYVGQTGDATGPHLHLEIQPNGPWNGVTSPDKWLSDRGVYIGC